MLFQCLVNQILICLQVLLFAVIDVSVDAIACTPALVCFLTTNVSFGCTAPIPPALECLSQTLEIGHNVFHQPEDCVSEVLVSFASPPSAPVSSSSLGDAC